MVKMFDGRDYEGLPWVAENGLRVEKRTSQSLILCWSTQIPDSRNTSESQLNGGDLMQDKDGINGPWYEVQMRKVHTGQRWVSIYKGYRTKCEVKELVPDAVLHFRMKRNGETEWGSTIIAATDSSPPAASDIHRAVSCNAEDMVLRIIGCSKGLHLKKLLQTLDPAGMNPLMIACQNGNVRIAELLLKHGAWINAPSFTSERTPLMYACMNGNIRMLELLDKYGVDWDMRDKNGWTAFHHAINSNKLSTLKYAVARVDTNIIHDRDPLGWSPLLRSVIVGNCTEVIRFLLSKGANVNDHDKTVSKSCLIAAVMLGKEDVCDVLLEHGADPTFRNANGMTAYDIAASRNHKDIASKIVKVLTDMATERGRPSHGGGGLVANTPGTLNSANNNISTEWPRAGQSSRSSISGATSRTVNPDLSAKVIYGTKDRDFQNDNKNEKEALPSVDA